MKLLLLIVIVIHALIHLFGFLKAFNLATIGQLSLHISKPNGLLWLATAILFITAAILFYLQKEWWWMVSLPALVISQYLIIISWSDTRFGTAANLIILLATVIAFGVWFVSKEVHHGRKSPNLSEWETTMKNLNAIITS